MLENHDLGLIVDGRRFGGWLKVRVTRGIERAAGSFDIEATQKWPGLKTHFEIPDGAACEIWIGEDRVMTGWVDVVDAQRDGNDARVQITGRSRTADLVDCSDDYQMVEMAGVDLAAVARRLCQPYGIEVVAKDTGPVFPVASANHGESPWKIIERLARQRQILVMDDPEGRLVLARLATERATDRLVHPSDGLKKASVRRDMSERFSHYIVKAQAGNRWAGGGGSEGGEDVPPALAHVEGSFRDPGVTRYRPKTMLSKGAAKTDGASANAEWQARRNIGRSKRVAAVRVGWRQSDGSLWRPNILVPCELPQLNLSAELAIAEVTYSKGDQGTLCEMSLAPPEAFTPKPPEAPQQGGGGGGGGWKDAELGSGA
jgi:prophage tail gpP-like protein